MGRPLSFGPKLPYSLCSFLLMLRSKVFMALGTSWLASLSTLTSSPARSLSHCWKKVCAVPALPARPVLPILKISILKSFNRQNARIFCYEFPKDHEIQMKSKYFEYELTLMKH